MTTALPLKRRWRWRWSRCCWCRASEAPFCTPRGGSWASTHGSGSGSYWLTWSSRRSSGLSTIPKQVAFSIYIFFETENLVLGRWQLENQTKMHAVKRDKTLDRLVWTFVNHLLSHCLLAGFYWDWEETMHNMILSVIVEIYHVISKTSSLVFYWDETMQTCFDFHLSCHVFIQNLRAKSKFYFKSYHFPSRLVCMIRS
ncbi:hypothetical protein C1H46_033995 [Malus baccata]|uniref:Uncharacterized protein n=1 Tax=Malus baccata TaxID=106549 RepID=A0A540L2I9_MALBA|nr:hypothetical protein C1H46_033995 [Malus baccata]